MGKFGFLGFEFSNFTRNLVLGSTWDSKQILGIACQARPAVRLGVVLLIALTSILTT